MRKRCFLFSPSRLARSSAPSAAAAKSESLTNRRATAGSPVIAIAPFRFDHEAEIGSSNSDSILSADVGPSSQSKDWPGTVMSVLPVVSRSVISSMSKFPLSDTVERKPAGIISAGRVQIS